jgi:hypothetical protein
MLGFLYTPENQTQFAKAPSKLNEVFARGDGLRGNQFTAITSLTCAQQRRALSEFLKSRWAVFILEIDVDRGPVRRNVWSAALCCPYGEGRSTIDLTQDAEYGAPRLLL